MRFSRNWIGHYTRLPEDLRELVERLSMLGLVVDDHDPRGDDLVLDLDLAANRPDVMNHVGVAREVGLSTGQPLELPEVVIDESGPAAAELARVEIDDEEGCPRYCARVITGVEAAPSPGWLCERLESIGLRPLNNVVDVTNFVLWELGHPLHAFDLDKLEGEQIRVRRALAGETLVTLDGIERKLSTEDLLIADERRGIALAGVMGGADTAIEPGATRVLLEGALFDPRTVRRMASRLGMHTDANHRFERGLAWDGMVAALDRAAALIVEVAGGEIAPGMLDAKGTAPERLRLTLRRDRVERLLGVGVPDAEITRILEGLLFEVAAAEDGFEISVPFSRGDVRREVDLIEEIARHYGYDRLPITLPTLRRGERHEALDLGAAVAAERRLRALCSSLGFWEAMTYSFTAAAEQELFAARPDDIVAIGNPLSEAMAVLRLSLAPGLAAAVSRNRNRGQDRVLAFEIGRCFSADGKTVRERRSLGLIACGSASGHRWDTTDRAYEFADLRGAVDVVWQRMGWPSLAWTRGEVTGLDPGACAVLCVDGRPVGFAGSLSGQAARSLDVGENVWFAQLDIEDFLRVEREPASMTAVPRYPASDRDVSLLMATTVAYADLEAALRSVEDVSLESFDLLDVYTGDDLPAGHRSLTLRMRYRASGRTLTSAEVEATHARVVDLLAERFDARRR